MIITTPVRNLQSIERLNHRCASQTFQNVIVDGTNCSPFEAEIIREKAEEIFRIGEHAQSKTLQAGQMLWRAIDELEPAGKPLDKCVFKDVVLTVHRIEDDQEVMAKHGRSAKRGQQILRMTLEAQEQGALLTQEDLATILDCDIKTIRMDIKTLQGRLGILIPTRGNKKDIGPGVTHRDKVIALYLQGKESVAIARDMKHSLKAVERYITTFCRAIYCHKELGESVKTALVMGVSVPLVKRCLELAEKNRGHEFYSERLAEIEKVGRAFWDAQDFKKNPGRKPRRPK